MHSTLFVQFALGGGRWDGRDILSPPVVVPPSLSAQHLPIGHVPSGETAATLESEVSFKET